MLGLWRYLPSLARSGVRRRATLADPLAARAALEELNAELAGFGGELTDGGELTEPPAQAGGVGWPLAAQSLPAAADAAAPLRGCGCGGCRCRAPRALHVHVHVYSAGGGQWELPASALTARGGGSTAEGVVDGGAGGGDTTHVHVHLPATTALNNGGK